MLQQDEPDDYVIATGETHTRARVRRARLRPRSAVASRGAARASTSRAAPRTGQVLVAIDPRYFRPTEVDLLLGDPAKARAKLGWRHTHQLRRAGRRDGGDDLTIAWCMQERR